MKTYQDHGLALLRISFSALMMVHGWGKLMKLTAGGEIKFFSFMGLGSEISLFLTIIGELIAPALILIGFQTRLSAIPAFFTMAVASLVVHASDPLAEKELALLYMFAFLIIMLCGPGSFSLDKKLNKE